MLLRLLTATLFLLCGPQCGEAAVRTVGHGESSGFDPSGFPPEMKSAYAIMQVKCVQCHTLERTVVAVTTGVAPISGRPFDRTAAVSYGQKMLRKQNARMSADEVKAVVELLTYLVDRAQPGKK